MRPWLFTPGGALFFFAAVYALALLILIASVPRTNTKSEINWYKMQTCMYAEEKFGGKVSNLCPRNDKETPGKWGLRQRI